VAENGVELHEEVVLMTTKGEAIALGIAQMSTVEISSCDHGVVATIKRVIMERDLYPKRWGLGPMALEKKKMKADGKLDKYGRPNENTPAKWNADYKDFGPEGQQGTSSDPAGATREKAAMGAPANHETTSTKEVLDAPPVAPNGDVEMASPVQATAGATNGAAPATDKKRKHEDETPEDKAERKRQKAEKKAKKAEKKAKRESKTKKEDTDESD